VPITLDGAPQVIARITKYAELFEDLTPSLQRGIDMGVDHAKSVCRVDTGEMRDSIYGQVNGPEEAEIGATAAHSIFNEFGTIHMEPQPFIEPGAQVALQAIKDDIRQRIGSLR
jgi:HK97 gp10 family phage protein